MMSGDVGTVQSRIELHCNPITPAQQKKHRCGLMDRICSQVLRAVSARDGAPVTLMLRARDAWRDPARNTADPAKTHISSAFSWVAKIRFLCSATTCDACAHHICRC